MIQNWKYLPMVAAKILWLAGLGCGLSAQTVLDSLYEKSGARHGVHISKITDTDLTFTYPNESLIYTWKLDRLQLIRFASGRVQNLVANTDQTAAEQKPEKKETERVTRVEIDNNAKPWEKLIVTYDSTDVANLKYKGPIRLERSAQSFDFGSMFLTRTMNDLRREAYHMNATHVLIISKEEKVVSGRVVKMKIQAKAYR